MKAEFVVAVHALIYLDHQKTIVTSDELANSICTNPAFVRKVMAKLKCAGLITTKEGNDGGYISDSDIDIDSIDLNDILQAVDATMIIKKKARIDVKECLLAKKMELVMDDLCYDLDKLCQDRLSDITIADIKEKICQKERVH